MKTLEKRLSVDRGPVLIARSCRVAPTFMPIAVQGARRSGGGTREVSCSHRYVLLRHRLCESHEQSMTGISPTIP
jgi:hypothetical protein